MYTCTILILARDYIMQAHTYVHGSKKLIDLLIFIAAGVAGVGSTG